jgi:hypothetical protein
LRPGSVNRKNRSAISGCARRSLNTDFALACRAKVQRLSHTSSGLFRKNARWQPIFRRPAQHFEAKLPISEGCDDQPAGGQRGVGLVMAGAAQRHQAIEIEVRAAARALDDVMDIQAATPPARLTAPPGPTADFALNRLPIPCVRKTSGRIP